MKLNYRKIGSGDPLFILHGVFGSADNWQSVGKMLADHFTVYLIDLRNHGLSPHSDEFNYTVMANDLIELMQDESLQTISIIGHSMGGKVAMYTACDHRDLVEKLVVVDISPRSYPPHHQDILAGFQAVDLKNIKSRNEAETQMSSVIDTFSVRQFLLKNLTRDEENNFTWKLNLPVIAEKIQQVGEALPHDKRFDKQALFIKGANSRYIQEKDEALIQSHFPHSKLQIIENAGHWVHAEQPQVLFDTLVHFLNR